MIFSGTIIDARCNKQHGVGAPEKRIELFSNREFYSTSVLFKFQLLRNTNVLKDYASHELIRRDKFHILRVEKRGITHSC